MTPEETPPPPETRPASPKPGEAGSTQPAPTEKDAGGAGGAAGAQRPAPAPGATPPSDSAPTPSASRAATSAPAGSNTGTSTPPAPQLQTTVPPDGELTVTIDGREVRVPKGTLLLDAATKAGIHIPIYCAHAKMDPVAVCRMCLVQVEKMPKLQPACATVVADGMVAHTQTPQVGKMREGVLEFLLLNHPLDCPICDRGGECDLQDFAFRYGPNNSRFPITDKVHFEKAVPLSDRIELDNERCILCWRCVRYYDEITGEKEIVLQQRGVDTAVGTFNDQPLQSQFQGNLPEVCPVGALTHRQYRFKARPWDLQRTKGVCPTCSYGCNINVDARDYEIKRFASRDNPLVDDMWLCDRGRYSFNDHNRTDRLRLPGIREIRGAQLRDTGVEDALAVAATQLRRVRDENGGDAIAVLGSAVATNEELWLLQRVARELLRTPHVDHQLEPFDDLAADEHSLGIAEIEECSHVVVLGSNPEEQAPVLTLRLFKAQRKRGVTVLRVAAQAEPSQIAERVAGARLVGVVADESNRAHAARVAAGLGGVTVRRLTVTRGVNGRGAKDLGLLPNLGPGYSGVAMAGGLSGAGILDAAAAGKVRALLTMNAESWLGDERLAERAERALAACEVVVAIETRPGVVSRNATVVLPGRAYFEKYGTVTNLEGRVQRIRPALPAATSVPEETRLLTMLATRLGATEGWGSGEALAVTREIRAALPAYAEAGNGGRALFSAAGARA